MHRQGLARGCHMAPAFTTVSSSYQASHLVAMAGSLLLDHELLVGNCVSLD